MTPVLVQALRPGVPGTGVRSGFRNIRDAALAVVDYGEGPVQEANLADPAYQAALEAHTNRINELLEEGTRRLLIKLGVMPYLEWDEGKQAAVDAVRETMQSEFGVELDPNDRYVWVTSVAMGTMEDWSDFTMYLLRRNMPTEAAIQEKLKKF